MWPRPAVLAWVPRGGHDERMTMESTEAVTEGDATLRNEPVEAHTMAALPAARSSRQADSERNASLPRVSRRSASTEGVAPAMHKSHSLVASGSSLDGGSRAQGGRSSFGGQKHEGYERRALRQSGLVEKEVALKVLDRVDLLKESDALALDIGGSLTKLMYIQHYSTTHHTDSSTSRTSRAHKRLVIDELDSNRPHHLQVDVPILKGVVHFFTFETRDIEECVHFLAKNWHTFHPAGRHLKSTGGNDHVPGQTKAQPRTGEALDSDAPAKGSSKRIVRTTGGGAFKYRELFSREIGVELASVDEMASVVAGLNFLLTHVDREVYYFRPPQELRAEDPLPPLEDCRDFISQSQMKTPFPYLLVNIGSGVSIIRVTGPGTFERVSGSALGGGTFWGLSRLLTNCRTFDEVIDLTYEGDNGKVDMLVGDIYGSHYEKLGLPANIIAASFGKVTMSRHSPPVSFQSMFKELRRAVKGSLMLWFKVLLATPGIGHLLRRLDVERYVHETLANDHLSTQFHAADVSLSLLRMLSYNIGQIAFLNAKRYDLQQIYFGGNFIRDHPFTVSTLSYAVKFWSQGQMEARFLVHDGYLGAVGAYLGGKELLRDDVANPTLTATNPSLVSRSGDSSPSQATSE
ncbi:Pantothenate kinase 2 [Porphyridium purpureum]|uniref:Pantothenate kinase 2 n=1 Tax=Porphyridium purpureum TaxID=35688 RepID=A0A5J4YTV7_PORPP|nr:Pantothenate kinase 2 [Porphyridium purpureum]|eukprot:POR1244..scf229_5